jgi:hypothetical protein
MQPDPVRLADTRAWLVKAANDLRAAAVDLAATPPLLEDALFHCQQAAEKAFKAFLTESMRCGSHGFHLVEEAPPSLVGWPPFVHQ